MERNQAASHDTDAFGSGKHGYKTTAPYTVLTPAAMNQIQEEIARAIEGFGVSLSGASMHQLSDLLLAITNNVTLLDAGTPVFGTQNTSHDHPSSASNAWKLIVRGKVADATLVRFFTGDAAASAGAWALTWNASWDPASGAQVWSKDATGQPASALICEGETLKWYGRASGAGTWNNAGWSSRGTLNLKDLVASGNVGGATVTGTTTVTAGTAVKATTTFDYVAPRTDLKIVKLSDIQPYGAAALTYGLDAVTFVNASDQGVVQLDLDSGSILTGVDVVFTLSTGTTSQQVELHKYTADFATPAPSTGSGAIASGTIVALSGTKTASITGVSETFDNATKRYMLLLGKTGVTHAGDKIEEIRLHYTNPGPRNY